MQNKLAQIKLSEISISETNKMFRDESELSNDALKELIDSIKSKGVIQPVLLRYSKSAKTKYVLIAGERRYRASVAAGKKEIPSYILEMSDEEAFDLQITENLQRKDVHPLKEAHAYKYLIDKDPKLNTVAELALRFGKTEHYILTRLKLNSLIPEAAKDYHDGLMSLGHAHLIARLTPEDQKKTIDRCSRSYRNGKEQVKYYHSVHELQEHINDDIICNLSSAAFKKDDATLIPKAGPCTTCTHRSGANQLFSDVVEKDRCFNPTCFLAKRLKFMARQIPELLEKQPDLLFLSTNYHRDKTDPEIEKVLKEHKVRVLKNGDDFSSYSYGKQAKAKGIYINGDEVGKRVVVYLQGKQNGKSSNGKHDADEVDAKAAIAQIKQRTERAAELDREKVYARILEAVKNHPSQKYPCDAKYYNDAEEVFFTYVLYNKLRYSDGDEVDKFLKIKSNKPEDLYNSLAKLTTSQKIFVLRRVMITQFGGPMPNTDEAYFIRKIAQGYLDIPIDQFEAEQAEIRAKREARAKERIAELRPKKLKKVKKEKVVASKKLAKVLKNKPMKEASVLETAEPDTIASRLPQLF